VEYNREERDMCAHLFRLLLENQPKWPALKDFLGLTEIENPRIFCEAALLRDAYFVREGNSNLDDFIDKICVKIAEQKNIKKPITYSQLLEKLKVKKIHPREIKYKIEKSEETGISEDDKTVYKELQGMFNAKPDIVICYNDQLLIYEAKYKIQFNKKQFDRTKLIGQIWANFLYEDLGFSSVPKYDVRKIGVGLSTPHVSWEKIYDIAKRYWQESDFSLRVLAKVKEKIDI